MISSESRSQLPTLEAARTRGFSGTGGADGESSAGRHELSGSGGVTNRHPAIRVRTRSVPLCPAPGYRVRLRDEVSVNERNQLDSGRP